MNKQDCCGKCSQEAPFDYIEHAHVTCSDKFYGGRVGFQHLAATLMSCIEALRELDGIKKSIFYGKGMPDGAAEDCAGIEDYVGFDARTGQNVIHGIIGIATEAGELLELLYDSVIDGKSFDAVNMMEESGDIEWYQALLAKAGGYTFEECQRKNIAKLRMRFGDKFSEFDANNRNLKAERSILESAISMTMPPNLHETTDATVWAKEFKAVCKRLTEPERLDEGFLIGWFANAIEIGRSAGKKEIVNGNGAIPQLLFDFMAFLTCREKQIVLSASDDAAPAVEAIEEFWNSRNK